VWWGFWPELARDSGAFFFEFSGAGCRVFGRQRRNRPDGESCGDDLGRSSGAVGIDGAVVSDRDEYDQYGGDLAGERRGWRQQRDGHDFSDWSIYTSGEDSEPEYFDHQCRDAGDACDLGVSGGVDFESDSGGVFGAGDTGGARWDELLAGCDGDRISEYVAAAGWRGDGSLDASVFDGVA
jgi:hypothetical protein